MAEIRLRVPGGRVIHQAAACDASKGDGILTVKLCDPTRISFYSHDYHAALKLVRPSRAKVTCQKCRALLGENDGK